MKGQTKKETNEDDMYNLSGGDFGGDLHALFVELVKADKKDPTGKMILSPGKERITLYKNFIYNRITSYPKVPPHKQVIPAENDATDGKEGDVVQGNIFNFYDKFIKSKVPAGVVSNPKTVEDFFKDPDLFGDVSKAARTRICQLHEKMKPNPSGHTSSPNTPPPQPNKTDMSMEKIIKDEKGNINEIKVSPGTLNILIIDSNAKIAPDVVFDFLSTLLNDVSHKTTKIEKVYYDDTSAAVINTLKKLKIVTPLIFVRVENDYKLLEEPPTTPINLVLRVSENNDMNKLSYALYFESLVSKPLIVERIKGKDAAQYKGEFYKTNPIFARFNNLRDIMFDFSSGKHTDFKSKKEHNDTITKYLTDAKKIAQVTKNNLVPESSDFLNRYLYEITLTEQQEISLKQDFAVSEYLQQLKNTVTDIKKIQAFERLTQDPNFANIWYDVSAIPNKVNMLVLTKYVDYDILFVLLKLLEYTKHRLDNVYIPSDAYDEKYFEELDLEKGTIAKIKAIDDGGLYNLLGNKKFSVNVVLDLDKGRVDYHLSEALISYHSFKNKGEHPNFFFLNDKNQVDFIPKFDVFQFFQGNESKVRNLTQDTYNLIVSSLKDRDFAIKKQSQIDIKEYNQTLDIDQPNKVGKEKSLSSQVNTLLDNVDGLINDFPTFVEYYKLDDIKVKDQNKVAVEDIKEQIIIKEDNAFYQIAQTLNGEEGLSLLEPLKKLDANIDVLVLNNAGIDFVTLVRDILAVFRLKVNTVYVKKQDSTDELTNILKPKKEVGYSNVYEILEKGYNVNLVINGSIESSLKDSLSNSQLNVLQDIIDKKKRVYIGVEKSNASILKLDVKDVLPNELGSIAGKMITLLKRFMKLSLGKKIGDQLVEFNEVVSELEIHRKDDTDLGFFLDKSTAQPVKQDVFTDDMKGLVTLLQERENKKMSENIMSNLDKFRNELKNAPKDNVVAIMGFTEAFSTFEIAIQTTRVMLKGVERNITKVFNKEATLDAELNRMLSNVVPYDTYDDLKKGNITFIVKGNAIIDTSFVLFLKYVEKPNLIVMIYDFDNQVVKVMTASQIIKDTKFAPENLDSLYSSFNSVDAIKSKIATLNANGKAYLDQKQNQFNMVKYVDDLTELNGIMETFGLGNTAKRELSMIISEYKDALTGIKTLNKAKGSIYQKLFKLKESPETLNSLPSNEQIQIKDIIRTINDAFLDNIYTTPESLKYKGLVKMIEEDFESLHERKINSPEIASRSLDHYFSHKFIQSGKENYESKIKAIKSNPQSMQFRKLKVLRNLFDTIYRLEFANIALKEIGKIPKKKNFQRLSIFPRQNADIAFYYEQDALYTFMRTGVVVKGVKSDKTINEPFLVAVSEKIVTLLIERNQTINKTQVDIAKTIADIMINLASDNGRPISNCQSALAIKRTLGDNINVMFTEVLGINWLTDQRFKVSDKMKKAFSPKSLDLHIIPSVIALEEKPLVLSYGHYDIPKSTAECKDEEKSNLQKGGDIEAQTVKDAEDATATVVVEVNKGAKQVIKEDKEDTSNAIPNLTLKDDDFGQWFAQCNKSFTNMIYKGSTDYVILTQRVINKGKEFLAQQLTILMKDDEIVLMEDIFDQVLGVSKELRVLGPSLSPLLNALETSISNMNKALINKEIANQYNLNLEFQKELTEKQMWLQVLLVFHDVEGLAKKKIDDENRIIQGRFDLELDKYEQICEALKKNQLFLDQSNYTNALLERKGGKESKLPEGNKSLEVGKLVVEPSKPTVESEAVAPTVDDNTVSPIAATVEPDTNAPVPIVNVEDEPTVQSKAPTADDNTVSSIVATVEPETNASVPIVNVEDVVDVVDVVDGVNEPRVESEAPVEPETNVPVPIVNGKGETPTADNNTVSPIETPVEPEANASIPVVDVADVVDVVNEEDEQTNTLMEPETGTNSQSSVAAVSESKMNKEKLDGGALVKDNSNQLAGIDGSEFMRLLEYIFDESKLKQDIKSLFDSTTSIKIKSANIPKEAEGFQFGGGFMDFIKKPKTIADVTASSSIPEFKKPEMKQGNDVVLPSSTTTDFASGIKSVVKDEEFEKLLVTLNRKYLQNDDKGSEVEVEKLYLDHILKENPELSKYIDISKFSTEDALSKEINTLNLRSFLSSWLKETGYDATRISKQIKSKRLDFDESDSQQKNMQTQDSQNSKVVNGAKAVEETQNVVSFSKQNDQLQNQEYTMASKQQYSVVEKQADVKEVKPEMPIKDKFASLVSSFGLTSSSNNTVQLSKKLPSLDKTHTYILDIINQLDNFTKKTQRKHGKWIDELNAMLSQGEVSMSVQIQTKVNMLGTGKLLEIERRKVSIQLQYLMKKIIRAIDDKSTVNYSNFKDFFFTEKRRQIKDLMQYLEVFAYLKEDTFKNSFTNIEDKKQAAQLQQIHTDIQSAFLSIISALHTSNKSFYATTAELIESNIAEAYTINMRDKERAQVLQLKKNVLERMEGMPEKIKYFYTLNYPITEMFDIQFLIMYVIKALRVLSYQFSMNMATNIFLQKYESTVYDKKVNPPSLVSFMLIFLGFDLFFNAFILVTLGLCGFLFKTDNNAFPIDKYLFMKYAFDYFTTTLVIMVIGILIGSVIKQKRYFRYKTEGERGIRAFEEIAKMSATVITLIPMFMLIS
jgi:hypothetical protein